MPSESVSRWKAASAMFASYGQTDLANEASHRAYMAELREQSDAAIAESKFHYADHARRARIADANKNGIPEPVDEALLVEKNKLPFEVQNFADRLANEGNVGELYSKDFEIKDSVSFRTTAILVEDETDKNITRCVAVFIEMGHPVAKANLLYHRLGSSWLPVEDSICKESVSSEQSVTSLPEDSLSPEEMKRINTLASKGDSDAETVLTHMKETPMEDTIFSQVLDKIKRAQTDGEITPERQAALTTMFTEFMQVYNQPDGTIEQMAAKQVALREIIERYQDVLNNPQLGRE